MSKDDLGRVDAGLLADSGRAGVPELIRAPRWDSRQVASAADRRCIPGGGERLAALRSPDRHVGERRQPGSENQLRLRANGADSRLALVLRLVTGGELDPNVYRTVNVP